MLYKKCFTLTSKWVKHHNVNIATMNFIKEKLENSLAHIGTGDNFLNRTTVIQILINN